MVVVGFGGWSWGLAFARLPLSHSDRTFWVGSFGNRVLLYARTGLDHNPPLYASCSCLDDSYTPLCPVIGWIAVLWTLCHSQPHTTVLLISSLPNS
jgi:hypothetical protein